jgi:Sec-independent protein translocase protein TatA
MMRLFEVGIIVLAAVALFGRNRLPDSVRNVKKSARIVKSEMQAAADDVELPEPKIVRGQVVTEARTTDARTAEARVDADQN